MFVGFSKNIGGGFRIGIGTKIGSNKKINNKELQTREFQDFLKQVEIDLKNSLMTFVEANGEDYYKLLKDKVDLDDVFKDNKKYHIFIKIYSDAKYEIEKILYSGDSGIVAKRGITEAVFNIKRFINEEYPNFKPKFNIKMYIHKIFTFIWKSILVIFILLLLTMFNIDSKNQDNKNTVKKEVVK